MSSMAIDKQFDVAKGNLAHSQALIQQTQPSTQPEKTVQPSQQMQDAGGKQEVIQFLKEIEQNIQDLNQRVDVLEQKNAPPGI